MCLQNVLLKRLNAKTSLTNEQIIEGERIFFCLYLIFYLYIIRRISTYCSNYVHQNWTNRSFRTCRTLLNHMVILIDCVNKRNELFKWYFWKHLVSFILHKYIYNYYGFYFVIQGSELCAVRRRHIRYFFCLLKLRLIY